MRLQTSLVAAASIAASEAFLITPDIANAVQEAKASFNKLVLGSSQNLDVECHNCPIFLTNEYSTVSELQFGVPNTLHLEFSTESGNLQVNNVTVFPPEAVDKNNAQIRVSQTNTETGEILQHRPLIAYVIEASQPMGHRPHPGRFQLPKKSDAQLINVDFTVLGLELNVVKAQTANVNLILHDGVYSIARAQAADFNPTAPGENDLEICRNARNIQMCRIRLMIMRRVRQIMSAAHGHKQTVKEWMKNHGPGNKVRPCHKAHPGHKWRGHGAGRGHGGHRAHDRHPGHPGHYRHHRYLHMAMFIVKALVVPAVLGFMIGFTVSAVGMLVGRLIVFLWMRFYRGSSRGNQSIRIEEEAVIEDDEKQGLMVEEEPPAYEYRDDIVVEEKA